MVFLYYFLVVTKTKDLRDLYQITQEKGICEALKYDAKLTSEKLNDNILRGMVYASFPAVMAVALYKIYKIDKEREEYERLTSKHN